MQMHTLDLGLVKHFLKIVVVRCNEHGVLAELNQRIQACTVGEYRCAERGLGKTRALSVDMVSLPLHAHASASLPYRDFRCNGNALHLTV